MNTRAAPIPIPQDYMSTKQKRTIQPNISNGMFGRVVIAEEVSL